MNTYLDLNLATFQYWWLLTLALQGEWATETLSRAFSYKTVSYYVNKETPVFSAFLDASKAFDRTNHNLLFAK